jgi:RimJ/RimL family protein N-acetyltransferase
MQVLDTDRLHIRPFTRDDAPFILALLNDPDFIRFIADKGVRTLQDAEQYILNVPLASYQEHGFGLLMVEDRMSRTPLGMCGLIKRASLDDVDIGYAFLPDARGRGLALEAARAVLEAGLSVLGLKRIVAITDPENRPSCRVLEKAGMTLERQLYLPGESTPVNLYVLEKA